MPYAAKVPCKGCGQPVNGGWCEACRTQGKAKDRRLTSTQRGYGSRWQKASQAYLREHPLCVGYPLGVHGAVAVGAECVDHIIAHKGDMGRFWDSTNWQPLCLSCNSVKAAKQEGGFGHGAKGLPR